MHWFGRSLVIAAAAVLLAGMPATAQTVVFTQLVTHGVEPSDSTAIASIPGVAGKHIRVLKVGIGGDADSESGPHRFELRSTGMNLSWKAGNPINHGLVPATTYTLAPTPYEGGPATGRGFSYADVSAGNGTAGLGESVSLYWTHHVDWDGNYTYGTDLQGNNYDDFVVPFSARAWVLYETLTAEEAALVPEPGSLAVFVPALGTLVLLRRRRKENGPAEEV